jgi:hypothetical protein
MRRPVRRFDHEMLVRIVHPVVLDDWGKRFGEWKHARQHDDTEPDLAVSQ